MQRLKTVLTAVLSKSSRTEIIFLKENVLNPEVKAFLNNVGIYTGTCLTNKQLVLLLPLNTDALTWSLPDWQSKPCFVVLGSDCAFSFQITLAATSGSWMETCTTKGCWSLQFLLNPCKTPSWSLLQICLDLGLLWSLYRNGPVFCKNTLIRWKFLQKRWGTWNRSVSLCASIHCCWFFKKLALTTFDGFLWVSVLRMGWIRITLKLWLQL